MASYTSTRPTSPIVWGLIVNTAHDSANVVEFINHSGDFIWPTISVSINLFPCILQVCDSSYFYVSFFARPDAYALGSHTFTVLSNQVLHYSCILMPLRYPQS